MAKAQQYKKVEVLARVKRFLVGSFYFLTSFTLLEIAFMLFPQLLNYMLAIETEGVIAQFVVRISPTMVLLVVITWTSVIAFKGVQNITRSCKWQTFSQSSISARRRK